MPHNTDYVIENNYFESKSGLVRNCQNRGHCMNTMYTNQSNQSNNQRVIAARRGKHKNSMSLMSQIEKQIE